MDLEALTAETPKTEPATWHLTLNQYQRNHLLHLLRTCGYPEDNDDSLEPFTLANTGDWLSEIHDMLVPGPPPVVELPIADAVLVNSAARPKCGNCEIMASAQRKLIRQVTFQRDKIDRIMMWLGKLVAMFDESDTIDWRENRTEPTTERRLPRANPPAGMVPIQKRRETK